ncbi:uncharacterized protein [Elaeis guineensis]|uniref:uncharacterized protein n=1 Tax=Elaeis guineensis var. tenera TaxID=51953 RepID=UPI003C6CE4E5
MVKKQKTEEPITFIEEDVQGVQFLHNDAVVVNLNIINYDAHRVLIDNESSVDILFYDAFSKMEMLDDRLGRMDSSFVEFIGDTIPVEGVIMLLVKAGQVPIQSIAQVNFLVIRAPSAYSTILGRSDIFVWTSADMPKIDPSVIMHWLNVSPNHHPFKQKKRSFAPEQQKTIAKEVDKLLQVGFIKEMTYSEWIENVIMMKKINEKW